VGEPVHNIATLLVARLGEPERVLYRQHVDGAWRDFTAAELATLVSCWQDAFGRAGLVGGDRVALALKNGVSWVAIDLAALASGLVVVPLYADDNAENQAWCAKLVEARLVVVENARMFRALVEAGVSPQSMLVLRPDEAAEAHSVERFLAGGEARPFSVAGVDPNALATICFTSGTGGRPKGVMLTHGNILANVEGCRAVNMARADDVFLSFLPLSHMFERTGGYYLPLSLGAKVVYARSIAQLADDLAEQKPTAMFAVPRVFEKFGGRIRAALSDHPLKQALFDLCVSSGWRLARGKPTVVDRVVAPLLRRLVAAPILARLGGRLRIAVAGGAALDPELARMFNGLGLPLLQGYGMTEAAPVISVNRLDDNELGCVGPALPNVEVRLSRDQELLVRGPNVMQGYWRDKVATARALDGAGWLHTGDLAEIRDGHIFIRGRLKDILVLSNGEKLPPQDVELAILGDDAFEQIMLIGEGRPFLSLIAVSKEKDEKALVRRANERLKSFPRYVRVRRAVVSDEPWTIDNGLVTPTLKVRRERVISRYKDDIDRIYAAGVGD